jgi:ribonuclease BN (tRNA processing enzyme)
VRLTTIGSGTAAPSASRVQSGHLVEAGDVRLLLDCGSGVVYRMAERGISWQTITHVALTHFHLDHIADVANLLQAWRHGQLPARRAPVEIVGPPGTCALMARVGDLFGRRLLDPGFPLSIRELAPGAAIDLAPALSISARKVPHTEESVAYSIEGGGRRIVYTGDTGFDAALGGWAAGCDVFLCECSLPEALAIPSHLTPRQCGALAAMATPALLALTHFYPPVEATDVRGAVAERFAGPTVLVADGWSIDLEDRSC